MDFGLFDWKNSDNKLLREETVYSSNVSVSTLHLSKHKTFLMSLTYQ